MADSMSSVLSAFEADLVTKYQRYSSGGALSSTGWNYLWKGCPDLPLDAATLSGIFASCVNSGSTRYVRERAAPSWLSHGTAVALFTALQWLSTHS